ncbi:YidC/Oxa1 family membrane protein insertase [Streptomyces sp. NBC_00083]|uniref:YidC/Oxa1 family membrane protein insertase n=1 Tax=Streptomyces sp. NBC_00083 TaxID=2975647 RepID=UPI0022553981|nr:YidC/Oxa1 family membrane protein insertase [Streptomyces sp. NBC_00083]MCX5382236.1 YidC/Oxa1 family membrane protein insertase [Streptomyces sp. NBC_00083]
MFSSLFSAFASLTEHLAALLEPVFHGASTAAAIVLFTALVRLAVHPLSRQAARGQKAQARLRPQMTALRAKHGKDSKALQKAVMELHAAEKVSPLSGCLPGLLQMPAFFLLYHVFSSTSIGGKENGLLDHALFQAPLGGNWTAALAHGGVFGARGLVYVVLFAIVAAVATFNYRRMKRQMAATPVVAPGGQDAVPGMAAMSKFMPLLSFGTLISVGVVPLAAALYLVTSTTWTAVERAFLYKDMVPAPAALATAA